MEINTYSILPNHLPQRNLVTLLESSITYLEQAERYEVMSEVYKLLQPFYEKTRDFEKMKEMYGKLHVAFKRVVEIMATGKRYLGTYFRIAFFGKVNSNIHNECAGSSQGRDHSREGGYQLCPPPPHPLYKFPYTHQ